MVANQRNNWVVDPQFSNTNLLVQAQNKLNATNNRTIVDATNSLSFTSSPYAAPSNVSPFVNNAGYWSNYFNGSTDTLTLPGSSAYAIATTSTPFTIEGWIRPTASGGVIFSELYTGAGNSVAIAVTMSDGGTVDSTSGLYPAFGYYSGSWISAGVSTVAVALNTWTHFACVFDGSACKVFINGEDRTKGGFATSWGSTGASGDGWYIGRRWDTAGIPYFSGSISNLRFVNGTAVYNSNFTPSTTPLTAITNTVLLSCQSNQFVDNSTTAAALTANGSVAVQPSNPFSFSQARNTTLSGCYALNSAYFAAPLNTATNFSNADFTIECWVLATAAPTTNWNPIISLGTTGGGKEIRIGQNINGLGLGFVLPSSASSFDLSNGYGALPLYTWTHLALVRYNNTVSLYKNGVFVGSAFTFFTFANIGSIYIGNDPYLSDGYFTGYISQIRITKGQALSTGNFTPPTAPVNTTTVGWTGANAATSLTGTVTLLLQGTEANIYDATRTTSLQTFGTASVDTVNTINGAPSIYFDSFKSYLQAQSYPGTYTYTGDFTFEAWIYPYGVNNVIVTFGSETTNRLILGINSSAQLTYDLYGVASGTFGTVALNTLAWSHVAFVRSSGVITAFVNGLVAGTYSTTSTIGNGQLTIGVQVSGTLTYYYGNMGDIRISNFARYTTTFTPPQVALPNQYKQ